MGKVLNQAPTNQRFRTTPGVVIAALRGGSGKTILSVGIIAALRNLGRAIAPFKKGPDYIDAGWLALAAGRPCYNLDTFLIDRNTILESYHAHTRNTDLCRYRRQSRPLRLHQHRRGNQHRRAGQAAGPAGDPVRRRHQDHSHHGCRGGRYRVLRPRRTYRRCGVESGGRQTAPKASSPAASKSTPAFLFWARCRS